MRPWPTTESNPRERGTARVWLLWILADDGDGLCRSDAIAWAPVLFAGDNVKVLLDDLPTPRRSVATAHEEMISDLRLDTFQPRYGSSVIAIGSGVDTASSMGIAFCLVASQRETRAGFGTKTCLHCSLTGRNCEFAPSARLFAIGDFERNGRGCAG
jgi:hypothetical protein